MNFDRSRLMVARTAARHWEYKTGSPLKVCGPQVAASSSPCFWPLHHNAIYFLTEELLPN
jgi:hypothetical protein